MSEPISTAKSCTLKPAKKLKLPKPQRRFALRDSDFETRNDSHLNTSAIRRVSQHDFLMDTNHAYRTFHYISVIFGAHDERTPRPYRGGLKKIVERQ